MAEHTTEFYQEMNTKNSWWLADSPNWQPKIGGQPAAPSTPGTGPQLEAQVSWWMEDKPAWSPQDGRGRLG